MAKTERRTSDEQEQVSDRNFRSSYYKSLGFKDSEKSITNLETLLKADIFDVKKLKSFCLKHTLTVFYRPLVWKIILSVIPVFSDNDTCSFVKEQKKVEFQDLKRTLVVMDRKECSGSYSANGGDGVKAARGGGNEGVAHVPPTHDNSSSHLVDSYSAMSNSTIFIPEKFAGLMSSVRASPRTVAESSSTNGPRHSPSSFLDSSSTNGPKSSPMSIAESSSANGPRSSPPTSIVESGSINGTLASSPRSTVESNSSLSTSMQDHRNVTQGPCCSPRDFVTIYLLQHKRLLSSTINQLKQQEQVDMQAIAEAFFTLFEEESEDDIYWLFASFMKKIESSQFVDLLDLFSETLEDIDCVLLEHIKDLDALDSAIPLRRWFQQCFARDLPESCIGSLWDRVIGGSSMVLVYVAVGIILSSKRRILSFSTAEQIENLISSIPQENYCSIVGKAIELWEDRGSPLQPHVKDHNEELCAHDILYEIEDYT